MFSCFSELLKAVYKQMANQIPEKTKGKAFTVSLIKQARNFRKKMTLTRVHNGKCQIDSVRAKTRNNWNRYLKRISVRIPLKQLDCSLSIEVIVNSAFDLINYHLKEISSL